MQRFQWLFVFFIPVILTSCASQSAMPLGNDMMQIDVSAAPVYGRAGAQRMAFEQAAKATIDAGYDLFIVAGNEAWTEAVASGGSFGSINANAFSASGQSGGGWGIHRRPEVNMIIRMYHYKDPGSEKAIDARRVLQKPAGTQGASAPARTISQR